MWFCAKSPISKIDLLAPGIHAWAGDTLNDLCAVHQYPWCPVPELEIHWEFDGVSFGVNGNISDKLLMKDMEKYFDEDAWIILRDEVRWRVRKAYYKQWEQ